MRKILYAVILLALFFAPLEKLDVAKLLPVESVAIYEESAQVVLETNTENKGRGKTVTEAFQNLKETTPAVIYLDTAKYLLVDQNAIERIKELRQYLKESVKVAICDAKAMVKEGAKYFDVHGGTEELRNWNS